MISSRNNASIFNFSILFDGKVNLVGTFGRLKFKIPNSFQKRLQEKQKKIKEKREFLVFDKINFGFWCTSKTNDRKYMKFSLNFYISFFYK